MYRPTTILVAAFIAIVPFGLSASAQGVPANIQNAVNDAARPADDKEADAVRMPGEMIAFAGVEPGDVVADLLPGRGYYTRMLSKTVGAAGKVYSIVPAENIERRATVADPVNAIAADAAYSNVTVASPPLAAFTTPEPVDVLWFTNNYHDVRNGRGPEAMAPLNRAIFDAVKPGGIFFVIDHRAVAGTPIEQERELHRIDPASLRSEIEAAGFVLEAESDLMVRPGDTMTDHSSFASSQAVYRFRKPQ
jgi:predicted methyltransferase